MKLFFAQGIRMVLSWGSSNRSCKWIDLVNQGLSLFHVLFSVEGQMSFAQGLQALKEYHRERVQVPALQVMEQVPKNWGLVLF